MIKIYTDASWRNGISSHNYQVFLNGEKIKKRTFLSELNTTPQQAEAMTIIAALKFAYKRNWYNVVIYTDCLYLIEGVRFGNFENEDYRWISHLLKQTGAKLRKRKRDNAYIAMADLECRKMMTTKMRRCAN